MALRFLYRTSNDCHPFLSLLTLLLFLSGNSFLQGQAVVTKANGAAADFQPARFTVPDGFTIELVAGPPLLHHPTLGCLDDQGRLFIADNAGVNLSASELEKQLPNSVRMLEDTDGDGRFDKSTLFADKMTYPMGGAWHNGALYVASPPNIWRLEDTDGDGVADKRDVLVSQFGYTGNAASIHGCFTGPDGRIYWCDGRHGHEFRDKEGQVTSKLAGSYIFSCKPDGSDVRIHCGGGMDNPVEVDFTDEGEMLGTVNIMYTRPRIDCLVHWLYGGVYPHSERVLYERKRTGDLLGPVHKFGHVAVSGTMRYRSGNVEPEFQNNFFTALFNGGKVLRVELQRQGATFAAVQREFLSGISPDIHITDVLEDADGSLLVVDTGGWFYRGCPTSQHSKPDIKGAIYRIRRHDRKPIDDPWGKDIAWNDLKSAQLVSLLQDNRFKVRERAIAECAQRGSSIVHILKQLLQRPDIQQRRNALWALTRIVGKTPDPRAQATIRLALTNDATSIRLTACRSLATYPDPAALPALLTIVKQDEPAVRREAAKAIGRIGDASAVPTLVANLSRDVDRSEEHALIYALIEINDAVTTSRLLGLKNFTRTGTPSTLASEAARRGMIAMHQIDPDQLTAEVMLPLLDADHKPLRMTALKIVQQHPGWSRQALPSLAKWLESEASLQSRNDVARGLLTGFLADPSFQELVGKKLGEGASSTWLLETIASGRSLPLADSWQEPIEQLLTSRDSASLALGISVVQAIKTNHFNEQLTRLASDSDTPAILKVAALSAASGNSSQLKDPAFQVLTQLIARPASPAEGTERGGRLSAADAAQAAQMIGNSTLTGEQLLKLAPLLEQAGPLEMRDLIRPFARNNTLEIRAAFLTSLEQSRSFLSLPHQIFSDIVKGYPTELRSQANELLDKLKAKDQQQANELDKLLPLLATGDAKRGETLFSNEKTKCASCHQVNNKGGKIGPDLSNIGSNRHGRDLLESIVFPSASLVRQYEAYSVVTKQGRVLTGLIARETRDAIYVQQQAGDPVMVPRQDIDELVPSTVSIMPNDLDKALSRQDLADLIAYLKTLKRTP